MTTAAPARVRYRDVLADREYRALFAADGLSVVGDQVTRLAVALLVLERTGSSLLAAATYACSYLSWLAGGPVLSSLADRLPRRRLMVTCDLARAGLVLLLLVPGLPLGVTFALLLLLGLLAPPFEAARSSLLADVLEGDRYVVGSALTGAVGQAGQVAGFLTGGALVALLGVDGALLVDATTFLLSAVLLRTFVRERPVVADDAPAPGLRTELTAGASLVGRTSELRTLLGWGVLIAAVTIAPEGLAVVVATDLGAGALGAGVLTAALPAGFLLGSWAVLRVPPDRRRQLFPWLTATSCTALLASPLLEGLWPLALAWFLAGTGTSLQLVANAAFVQAVPPALRGRAYGVAGTLLMAVQGVVLLGAGALADVVGPRESVALLSATGLAVLFVTSVRGAQGSGSAPSGRGTP